MPLSHSPWTSSRGDSLGGGTSWLSSRSSTTALRLHRHPDDERARVYSWGAAGLWGLPSSRSCLWDMRSCRTDPRAIVPFSPTLSDRDRLWSVAPPLSCSSYPGSVVARASLLGRQGVPGSPELRYKARLSPPGHPRPSRRFEDGDQARIRFSLFVCQPVGGFVSSAPLASFSRGGCSSPSG